MNEPTIICPNCKTEIKLTELLLLRLSKRRANSSSRKSFGRKQMLQNVRRQHASSKQILLGRRSPLTNKLLHS